MRLLREAIGPDDPPEHACPNGFAASDLSTRCSRTSPESSSGATNEPARSTKARPRQARPCVPCPTACEAGKRAQRVVVVVEDGEPHRGQPSARRQLAVLPQVLRPGGGHRDERTTSRRKMTHDETSVVSVLPHRGAGTRCLPGLEHFGVGTGVGAYPLEEVEDQGGDGVRHSDPVDWRRSVNTSPRCRVLTVVPGTLAGSSSGRTRDLRDEPAGSRAGLRRWSSAGATNMRARAAETHGKSRREGNGVT
jgi:hypothetical protein